MKNETKTIEHNDENLAEKDTVREISLENVIDDVSKTNNIPKDKLKRNVEEWIVALMNKGVVVSLEIKRWRANSKVSPDEVGIDDSKPEYSEYKEKYLTLGNKKLLPKRVLKEIASIENRARKNLEDHSIETVWGRFIPHTSFKEWKDNNDGIRAEFFNKANEIATNWLPLGEEVINDYENFISSNYEDKTKHKEEIEETKRGLVEDLKREMITPEHFVFTFDYEVFFTYIPLPSVIQKDLLEQEKLRLEQEQLTSEAEMNERVREEILKKKSEHIDEFLQATAGAIGESTKRILDEVRIAIGENGEKEVSPSIKKKLLKLIKTVRSLDFFQEDNTVNALNKLEVDLNSTKEEKKTFNSIKESVDAFEKSAKSMFNEWIYGRINMIEI